jgi:hypothetical protein
MTTLLEWWEAKNGNSGGRLILILDSSHSYMWAQAAKKVRSLFLAVQSCRYIKRPPAVEASAVEGAEMNFGVGAFTKVTWILFLINRYF